MQKIPISLLLFFVILFQAHAQVQSRAFQALLQTMLSHSVPELSVAEAAKQQASILFVDAREYKEFEVSHLQGAVHVGYDYYNPAALAGQPRDRRIVVYCSIGYRSEKIAEKLRAAGFTNVSNLYGGIFEWVNQGHPVCNAQGSTPKVHAFDRTWGVWLERGEKVF